MALVLADRVKETTTTTGTATYTLAGAATGFESFASIGDGNTTYYACTDGTDFEVGIGTYTASGTTLARTTILQSSNSDAAVSWSSGTKTIFCCQPAEKAVFLDASGNIAAFNGSNLTNVDAQTLDSLDSTQFLRSDAADTKTSGNLAFNDDVKATFGNSSDLRIYHDGTFNNSYVYDAGTGHLNLATNGTDIRITSNNGSELMGKFIQDGAVELYHDNSKKLETTSTGGTITGDLTLNSTADSGAILKLVSNDPADAADFGIEGVVQFYAENDASESTLYYSMQLQTSDVSDGTEDGWLYFNSKANGTLNVANALGSDGSMYILGSGNGGEGALKWFQTKGTSHTVSVKPNTPTADRNIFLPDASGTVLLADGDGSSLTNVNATTLDSVDSTSFLRSDAADTKTSGNLTFNDNIKALFGTSSDLQIFHNGSNSIIYDGGTGELQLQTDGTSIKLLKANTNEILANFIPDGSSQLYYDASKKFETSSTGATVTGGLTANVTGSGTEVLRLGTERPWAFLQRSTGASSSLAFRSTVDAKTFDIENEDGGIVARFISDNSDGKVALYYGGSQKFITTSTGSQIDGDLTLKSTDAGATENPTLDLYRNSASPADNDVLGHITFTGENSAGEKIVYAEIDSTNTDVTDGTEDGRLIFNAMVGGTLTTYYSTSFGLNQFNRTLKLESNANIIFEGATTNENETTLTVIDPTSDNTISLPDKSGTVAMTSDATSKAIAFSLVFG